MDSDTQWAIIILFLLLILLIILLFYKTPFLALFTTNHRWEKIDENSGILEHWTNSSTPFPIRNHQEAFDKRATTFYCNGSQFNDFIKMNYNIQDEKGAQQDIPQSEYTHSQQVLDAAPDVHVSPDQQLFNEQLQCSLQFRRCISTESLDSAVSSIMEVAKDVPTIKLTLKYEHTTQMFSSQLHHLTDVYTDYGQIWLLFFLLPHPKPLWRTEARVTPSSFIDYNVIYQQCVRRRDLHKIALLIQLFSNRKQSISLEAQTRIRLKDLSLANENGTSLELALLPIKSKSSADETANIKLGEILFLTMFTQDRLTVIVSKIRDLSSVYKSVFVRLYIVQPMGQVIKKKTSERVLVDGGTDIGESMFFAISRSRVKKSHLRLSIVCESEETHKSIGHVTLGPKSSGKELGHWQRALNSDSPPLMSWHLIRPRSTV